MVAKVSAFEHLTMPGTANRPPVLATIPDVQQWKHVGPKSFDVYLNPWIRYSDQPQQQKLFKAVQ